MSARQRVLALAHGAAAEVFDEGDNITLWTPPRVAWTATGGHSLSAGFRGARRADLWAALHADARQGIELCTQTDCDTCGGNRP